MRRLMTLGLGCLVFASPLYAALKPGAQAPAFTTQATLAGNSVHVFTGRRTEERPGRAVFLSGGLYQGLHGRSA